MPNQKNQGDHTDQNKDRQMDQEDTRREGQSRGGSASGGNFKNDPDRAAEAGRKGGQR